MRRHHRSLVAPALLLVAIGALGLRGAIAATTTYSIVPGGPPVTVAITAAGDDAAAVFDGTTGQRVSLKMTNVTIGPSACCSTKVSIRKPDGTTLVAPVNVGTSGGFVDAVTLPTNGSYTIFVDPTGSATGNMTLTLYDVPADVTGTIVPGGPAVSAATTTPGQNVRLAFDGTAAQRVSLKVGPVCCSTRVSILRPGGATLVAPVPLGTSGGFIEPVTLPTTGAYTIVVDLQNSFTGSVTLTLYDVPADVTGTIVAGGPAATVTTTTPGQNARLTFDGTAGQRVSLKVGPVCCSIRVSILRPDGTMLVAPTPFGTAGGFIDTKTLTMTGTHTIVADPQSSATGSMTLTLYDVPPDIAGEIVPSGPSVTVTTTTPGQNARLTFGGTAGARISLNLTAVTMSTASVSILKPDGTALVAPFPVGTNGAFVDTKTLPASGTYVVVVDPQGTAVGSMTLTLYEVPADATAAAVPSGGPVTVTTTTPGQNANVTFDGVADQRVTVRISGVTIGTSTCCSTKVSILKPDGTALVAPMNVGTNGVFIDARTLPLAGTYTIVVDAQGAATGSATITVADVTDTTTTIVPGGPAVTVTTTSAGENARLTFAAAAGARVSLAISNVTISSSIVSILAPSGATLVSGSSVAGGTGFLDATALPVDGTYTILVDPQGTGTGSMTLRLYDVPPDVTAPITPGGAATTVSTTTPGQNAKVTFTGAAAQRVFLKISNVTIAGSTCCTTRVSISKPDGTTLVAPVLVGTNGGFIDTTALPVDGVYTILVDPQAAATGGMTLTLYEVPADVSATITPGGPAVTISTTTAGQNARVTFDGVAGRGVSLKVGWTPSVCCLTKVSILRPDAGTILAPLSVGATGAFIDARQLPVSGTYTILVDPENSATGTATLTLFDVPPDVTAPITSGGPAVTLTTTAPGQNARFTFTAAAGDGAFVTVGPNCCSTNVSILKPDGVAIAPAVGFGAAGGTMNGRLPVFGTYTILVDLQGQLTGSVTVRLVLDASGPTIPVLTITEASPSSHASGATFYYRPAGTGSSFTVNAAVSDSGTGIQKVTFPGLTGGFTPTLGTTDMATPYSQQYNWVTGATFNGASNKVTAFDFAGNSSGATFAVVPDSDPPTTTDDTGAIGSAWKNTTQTVTLAPTDAGSGVAATYYTSNGTTPTTLSPQGTAVTLATDGVYTVSYFSQDNVGNVEAVRTAATQIRIDKTNPTSTTTFPASGRSYNAPGWSTGCAVAGLCGTASDALSGVARVELSIRQGAGNYWDGAAFASPSEVFVAASGTTTWSYAFGTANFPADGSYTIRVRAIDNATNAETPVSRTFTYDTAPPNTTITTTPAKPSNSASASFSFSSSETGSTFQCSLDGGAFAACTSPKSYTGLAAGSHTFEVRATDAAGNTDPTPASHTWTIDLTAPDTTITSGPPTASNSTAASFSFTSNETATFQCGLDGGAFAACTSPRSYTGLAAGTHTFRVRAVDSAGNIDATPASYSWTVDLAAPNTTITAAPASASNSTSASFAFTSSETGSTFECALDGAAFTSCTSPRSYTGLAAGSHTFEVRATDAAGNTDASPASHTWTIDLTAPETTITSGPSSPSNSADASFSFSSNEAGTFQCSLDGGAFTACTTPKNYTGLAAGAHTFRVRAVDTAGNVDATPAIHSWTIDLTAPETTIASGPTNPTNQTSASFSFSSSEAGSSFACSLDGAAFTACTSPQTYSGLAEGGHSFAVRATDPAGNTDATAATRSWTIDLTAPETTITAGPPSASNSATASFSFSSSEAGSSFECSLDGGAFLACTSPQSYSGLGEGMHSFEVRATDAAGNTDAVAAARSWTIDLTAPAAPAITAPGADTTTTSATVTLAGTAEPGASVQLFDGGSPAGATAADGSGAWTLTLTAVADGTHAFTARATDAAGNASSPSNTRTVTVDTSAPETSIGSGPANPTNQTSASFSFSSSEAGSSFECSLDGGAFVPCATPESYGSLAEGGHTFAVRATDPAGNTDATAATRSWTIDLTVPETTITSGPPSASNSASASFSFSSSEAGTFQCSLDGAAFAICTSPQSYGGLAEGPHSFEVRATDAAGNTDPAPASHSWTIDVTTPDATITSGPPSPSNSSAASFSFIASETGSFECSVDGAAFTPCTSPQSYTGLAAGTHTFRVRAIDAAGNTDPSPASHTWAIDLTAPETTITSGPPSPSNSAAASFSFSSSEAGTFQCSLDNGAFTPCTSGEAYSGLAEGPHSFEVRATDTAGNTDATPATHGWTIDLTAPAAPAITAPGADTTTTSATVTLAGTAEPGASVHVFDGGSPVGTTVADGSGGWTMTLTAVGDGAHTYTARASDAAGNTSSPSNARTVTVDTIAPETTITSAPADPTNQTSASFSFSSSEAGTFQCSLDGAAFTPCTSGENYTALGEGPHSFEVRATDAAGNTDPTTATHSWTIDVTSPETTISSGPADPTSETTASFSFSSSETGSSFECALDGGAFAACTDPQDYTGLAPGSHAFEVRATDAAGNVDASAATYSWTIL